MANCVRNFLIKNYQNLIIGFHVTVENVVDVFLRHSVVQTKHEYFKKYLKQSRLQIGSLLWY